MLPICIYHANCTDGFGAAWVLHDYFGEGNVIFVAASYGETPPDVTGREVFIVDFSYKRDTLLKMAKSAAKITVIDHHKTAKEDLNISAQELAEGDYCPAEFIFDMEHSGAILTWKYFHGSKEAPKILQHIEDRDLWKFDLPGTRAVAAALYSYPMDFVVWDQLMKEGADNLRISGEAIDRAHLKNVHGLIKYATYYIDIAGYNVPCINAPHFLASDLGNILSEPTDVYFAVVWTAVEDKIRFSLRSSKEHGIDVSEIAKLFGGGGHKNAAGFELTREYLAVVPRELMGEL